MWQSHYGDFRPQSSLRNACSIISFYLRYHLGPIGCVIHVHFFLSVIDVCTALNSPCDNGAQCTSKIPCDPNAPGPAEAKCKCTPDFVGDFCNSKSSNSLFIGLFHAWSRLQGRPRIHITSFKNMPCLPYSKRLEVVFTNLDPPLVELNKLFELCLNCYRLKL